MSLTTDKDDALASCDSAPRYITRAFGMKRVTPISAEVLALSSLCKRSKRRTRQSHVEKISILESVPQDILIRILCFVNHSDLKQLIFVSRTIREAALVAKELHFAFQTPVSKPVFRKGTTTAFLEEDGDDHQDAPNAPMRLRKFRPQMGGKWPESIAVALFRSNEEEDTLTEN